jgi:hypothetical protein
MLIATGLFQLTGLSALGQPVMFATKVDFGRHDSGFNETLKEYFEVSNKSRYSDRSDFEHGLNNNPFEADGKLRYLFLIEKFVDNGTRVEVRIRIFEARMTQCKLTLDIQFYDFESCDDWFRVFKNDIIDFNIDPDYKNFGKLTYIQYIEIETISEQLVAGLSDVKCLPTKFTKYADIKYGLKREDGTVDKNISFIIPKINKIGASTKHKFSCDIVLLQADRRLMKTVDEINIYSDLNNLFAHFLDDFNNKWRDEIYASFRK